MIPALPADVEVTRKPLKLNSMYKKGIEARLELLSYRMTDLVKKERVELQLHHAIEIRPYFERVRF